MALHMASNASKEVTNSVSAGVFIYFKWNVWHPMFLTRVNYDVCRTLTQRFVHKRGRNSSVIRARNISPERTTRSLLFHRNITMSYFNDQLQVVWQSSACQIASYAESAATVETATDSFQSQQESCVRYRHCVCHEEHLNKCRFFINLFVNYLWCLFAIMFLFSRLFPVQTWCFHRLAESIFGKTIQSSK